MAYKRLSRKDYQNLIGIANEKKKPRARRRRKSDQRGGITVPDLLLAKMISNDNRNRAQRDAMIDTMNKSQVRRMGKHQITCKDYKVAVKKSRICKGNNRK